MKIKDLLAITDEQEFITAYIIKEPGKYERIFDGRCLSAKKEKDLQNIEIFRIISQECGICIWSME